MNEYSFWWTFLYPTLIAIYLAWRLDVYRKRIEILEQALQNGRKYG